MQQHSPGASDRYAKMQFLRNAGNKERCACCASIATCARSALPGEIDQWRQDRRVTTSLGTRWFWAMSSSKARHASSVPMITEVDPLCMASTSGNGRIILCRPAARRISAAGHEQTELPLRSQTMTDACSPHRPRPAESDHCPGPAGGVRHKYWSQRASCAAPARQNPAHNDRDCFSPSTRLGPTQRGPRKPVDGGPSILALAARAIEVDRLCS